MDTNEAQPFDDNGVSVDQQDGGPASDTEHNSSEPHDDVASGGTTEGNGAGNGHDTSDSSIEHDVHGDPDTVS